MNSKKISEAGFTLLEVLVAITLIALLVGALAPTVLNQLDRGETNRIVEDLKGVENGAKMFRVDVRRWPGDIEDLVSQISTTGDTIFNAGGLYPTGLISRWNGTYLEGRYLADNTTIETGAGGLIQDNFSTKTLNNDTYLTVKVKNLTQATIQAVSLAVDGDTITADTNVGGRVRLNAADTSLVYLAVPVD